MSGEYDNNLDVQPPGKFNKLSSINPIANQTFLNCDIKGFNLHLGYNGQETEMTLDLVERMVAPVAGQKGNTKNLLNETYPNSQSCLYQPSAQPCQTLEYNGVLGNVYTVRIYDVSGNETFNFSGILQDHDIKVDTSGRTISVRLTDARQYLDNVTIIANKHYGRTNIYSNTTGTSRNILNVLYEIEPNVSAAFDKATGYAGAEKCLHYMDSGADKDGMPILFILGQFMTSDRYLDLPLSTQRIRINIDAVYNAALGFGQGYPIPHRISQSSLSLLDLLQETCQHIGHDLYVYIEYTDSGYEIVAKTLDKTAAMTNLAPVKTQLNTDYYNATPESINIASVTYGQEAVVENTRNIVIGANHRYFVEIERDTQLSTYRDNSWQPPSPLSDPQGLDPEELDQVIPDQNFPVSTQDFTEPPGGGSCYDPTQWANDFCTCATPNGGGRIAMLLGETMNGVNADGIPTYRLNLSNLCGDIIDTAYPIGELGAMLGYNIPGATARLSQEELLFSETYESYINWSVMHPGSIGFTFGQLIFGPLWGNFEKYALKIFADIVDNGSFDGFRDPALAFPDAEVSKKLFEVVHQFVKNIYDTYYGKEYVVLLDSKIDGWNTFDVCIGKNYDTWRDQADYQNPSSSPGLVTLPFSNTSDLVTNGVVSQTIKSAGSNGYLNASDTIANGAWFAGSSDAHSKILGLDATNGLSLFLNDDNTIGAFVKYGPYENICKRIGNKTFCFRVDFSSLDPSDFLVYQGNLYLKASFSEEMYFTKFVGGNFADDKVFARFSLPRVKLVPSPAVDAVGRAASRLALIALQVMTDPDKIDQITSGQITLENAVKDKLAGGGINPGIWDGVAANLAVTNLAKISIPAIVPLAVAIPFESQTMTYGPFAFSKHSEGGVNIVEHDLAPWHFGFGNNATNDSFSKMFEAGSLIARNNAMGRTYQEKATVSRLGIPNFSIGSLFVQTNAQSAILTDINFSFGSEGAKTQSVYQTYSPKYGSTPQYLVETAKKTTSYKLENIKKFRENAGKNRAAMIKLREDLIKITAGRGGGLGGGAGTENPVQNSKYDHSPSKLLVGGYYNKNTQSEITNNSFDVGSDSTQPMTHNYQEDRCEDIGSPPFPLSEPGADNTQGNTLKRYASSEIHPTYAFDTNQKEYYKNMSIMSIDGIFLPVSVNGGPNNNLVRYANFSRPGDLPKSRPIHSMPPIKYNSANFFNLDINNTYLNPILNVSLMSSWDDRTNNSDKGFVIMNIGQGSSPEENFNFDDIKEADGSVANSRDNFGDFRFHALRGPLVLQSWGYDINGKPIPNANDSAAGAERGDFNDVYLKDKFLKNWLANPKTWPVGPIDLRWDRHRGVWVSPPGNKIIIARLTSNLQAYSSATAELLNPDAGGKDYYENYSLHGPAGENIKEDVRNCTVTVYDYLGQELPRCAMVYVYYDDGKYIVINAGVNLMQRARIGTGQTLSCNGKCKGELFTISDTGAYQYGDANSIEIIDTMGLVPQVLSSLTRLWVVKLADSPAYEIVYIGNREGANCGSCGGFGVYSIAGVDFTKLPTVTTVGSVMTVTEGGCLALVSTADCAKTLTE